MEFAVLRYEKTEIHWHCRLSCAFVKSCQPTSPGVSDGVCARTNAWCQSLHLEGAINKDDLENWCLKSCRQSRQMFLVCCIFGSCYVRLKHRVYCALFSVLHHVTSFSHVQIKSVHCLVTNQFSFISHAEAQPGSARIVMTNNFSPSNAWYEKQHNHFTIFFIFSYFSVYYKCGCLQ